ncbi:hypothetical protein TNCV_1730321 [Trichonephila clavipes]|nr:hypothetical protein TNCV_1730321 [Trichonephila clavipes]
MPKKKCALRKGVTKRSILKESVANWVLENRLNGLIVTRNSVRLFALKWSKKNAFSCYPTMKVHKYSEQEVHVRSLETSAQITIVCRYLEKETENLPSRITKSDFALLKRIKGSISTESGSGVTL